jgi:hypothetical protein
MMDRHEDNRREVVVMDISMPFGSMVVFMVKWAIAAIPAMIILGVLWGLLMAFFFGLGGVEGGIFGHMQRMHV